MQIGIAGLGKMGANILLRLKEKGHDPIGFDPNIEIRKKIENDGGKTADSFDNLTSSLKSPKIVWIMVPSGKITENVITELSGSLDKNDIIIDGGNSFYKDTIRRNKSANDKGIFLLDAGTSGGIWGLKIGYCLMVGGDKKAFDQVEPVFKSLAPEDGYAYIGPSGSGHFVKMVHNGIEYAMLQAYGEGFEIINAKEEFNVDLNKLSHLWNQGSVIRSWLLELAEDVFDKDPKLETIKGYVEDSGEGRWTVATAIEENVPAPLITLSLLERLRSRQDESFTAKVIAALRNEFGGHSVKKS